MNTEMMTRDPGMKPPFKRMWWKQLPKFLLIGALALSVFGGLVMLLWNWLIPELFNGPKVTFLQAVGLLALSKILFGGKPHGMHRRMHGGWKRRMQHRWQAMTPEEREKVRSHLRGKWCC